MNYVIVSDYEDDEDGVLFWSNEEGWGHRSLATVFNEDERNDGLGLPDGAAGWVRASSVRLGPPDVILPGEDGMFD